MIGMRQFVPVTSRKDPFRHIPGGGTANFLSGLRNWHIIVAAVALRLAFCFLFLPFELSNYYAPLRGETFSAAGSDGYIQIARTLLETGRYAFEPGGPPVHNRPPLQPVLMLLAAWSADYWYYWWLVVSALLAGLTLVLLAGLAKTVGLAPSAVKALLILVALHPYLIYISKSTTFAVAATLVLVLTMDLFFRIRNGSLVAAMGCGLACGVGALAHGGFLLLPVVLGVFLLLNAQATWPRRLASGALIALGCSLVVLPWTWRNYQQFGKFIPVVTGQGIQYWLGETNYFVADHYSLGSIYHAATGRDPEIKYTGTVHPEDDALLWSLAKQDIMRRPVHMVERLGVGIVSFWTPWYPPGPKAVICAILNFPVLAMILTFAISLGFRRRLQYHQIVLMGTIVYFNLVFAFFLAALAYFVLVLPLVLLLLISLAVSYYNARAEAALGA